MRTNRRVTSLALLVILSSGALPTTVRAQGPPYMPPGRASLPGSAPPLGSSSMSGLSSRPVGPVGGLSDAFGPVRQGAQPATEGPKTGRRYAIPERFAGAAPGTVVQHGRYYYVIGQDGTMGFHSPVPGQHYRIPAQYAGTPPGYVIPFGRFRYLSGADGTMSLYTGPVAR